MKKNLFFYLNKILYNEVIQDMVNNPILNREKILPRVFVPSVNNDTQIDNNSVAIDKKFRDILNNTSNLEVKKFLEYIYKYGNDELYKKIINRLQNQKEIESAEEKYLKNQVDILKQNPNIEKTIVKFTKDNSNLNLEQLKDKFSKEDLNSKKEVFKNILNGIDDFKRMQPFMQNKIINDYGKELAYDTVQNVVDMFLKNQIKNEISKAKLVERNKMLREQQAKKEQSVNKINQMESKKDISI